MSESNQLVRVGYLSFWGARRNKVLELEDALPLSEANENLNDAVVKFRQFSTLVILFLIFLCFLVSFSVSFSLSKFIVDWWESLFCSGSDKYKRSLLAEIRGLDKLEVVF